MGRLDLPAPLGPCASAIGVGTTIGAGIFLLVGVAVDLRVPATASSANASIPPRRG